VNDPRHDDWSTLMTTAPELTLNNGVHLPAIGLGVFQAEPQDTTRAVEAALATGYRHIDTAASYGNEREVGEAIRRSGVDRGDVFIETKVWISDYGYDETLHAFDKSAAKLRVEQIDLLILHQPLPTAFDRTIGAYKALETLLADDKVQAIGVSNFLPEHLESLLAQTDVVPAVNQIELHPYFTQTESREVHARHGIVTQAWSPIGGITAYREGAPRRTFADPTILEIARSHDKSAAQVMLRWHLQRGRSAIPKSVRPERIAENFDIFDFALSADELAAVDSLDTGLRGGPAPADVTLEAYGRPIPEA
jgi:diketogulonate reductase-like aldo/keto reductase